jgi:hypothetical protein
MTTFAYFLSVIYLMPAPQLLQFLYLQLTRIFTIPEVAFGPFEQRNSNVHLYYNTIFQILRTQKPPIAILARHSTILLMFWCMNECTVHTYIYTNFLCDWSRGSMSFFSPDVSLFWLGEKRLNEPFVIKIVSKIVEILAFLVLADWHIVFEQ